MKRKKLLKSGILFSVGLMIFLFTAMLTVNVSAAEISNPVYDANTDKSVYSYVYFGHYPQSEITGDDLTNDIINANYNVYGVGIINNKRITRVNDGNRYHYYLDEPLKWKVLKTDDSYMWLQTDKIIDNGINYDYYNVLWNNSILRSWLNGYTSKELDDFKDCSIDKFFEDDTVNFFVNFKSLAFFEEEYDICQLIDTYHDSALMSSDYVIIPTKTMVTNTDMGFNSIASKMSGTRQKIPTDYALICAQSDRQYITNRWYLMDGYITNLGDYENYYNNRCGISPIVKILVDSDQYYTSKPELVMGKDIALANISLKYSSINYSGEAKKPPVTVTYNGELLIENVDYTVSYSNNVNAGTATVTITGCGNFYGSKSTNFTINRLNQTISKVNSSYTKVLGDSAFRLNAVSTSKSAVKYSSSNSSVVVVAANTGKVTIKGTGTATITVTAPQTTNYNQATKKIKITVKPKKVTGLKSSSPTTSSVKLSWSKASGVTGYEIYRYSTEQEEYKKIKTITSNNTSFTNKSLGAGKVYKYKVRAYKTVGSTKYYGQFSSVVSAPTKPAKGQITSIKPYKAVKGVINVKIKKISCSGYQVQWSSYKSMKNSRSSNINYTNGYISLLKSGQRCYVRVRAYREVNGKKYYGQWSAVKSAKAS